MARVFVSYASKDQNLASELHHWLVADGHEVFLDRDLRDGVAVGEDWDRRLSERLRWADAMVCVVTSAYLASTWCTAEVGIARARGSRLLPVLAEPGIAHPLLRSNQHTDMTRDLLAARASLSQVLRRIDAVGGFGWPDDRSPFPGLRPFDVEQHRVFFGRVRETEELAELLRSPAEQVKAAVLLVVGPSGCGKSSLVRAGLLHIMASEPRWQTLPPILPGADPVAALVRQLAAAARRNGLDWPVNYVRDQLAERGLVGLVDELLLVNPGGPGRRLLIVVDQFEELLTQSGPRERAQFVQLLRSALGGSVQVIATLRPEFLDQLLRDANLAVLPVYTYTLRPLHREALHWVIQGPAQVAGIAVDDGLVARLVADTGSGEALPLLAFTLAQLAESVSRGGRLSAVRYEQLGGVQGALTRQADAALAEASAATGRRPEEVIAGLLRLVTVNEQGHPTWWRVPRDDLPEPVTLELKAFVARRLVTTDTTDNASVVLGVAHEAFLFAWAPLAHAIDENVSALRARRAVEQAAAEWEDGDRSPARLWERGQLAAALTDTGAHLKARDLVTDRVELSPTARVFLRTSIRRDRLRRRRAVTVLSMLLVLAVVAAGIAIVQRRAVEQQHRIAVARQLLTQVDAARDTDPRTALLLGIAAQHIYPSGETLSSLVSTLTTSAGTLAGLTNPAQPRRLGQPLTDHSGPVSSVAFSPDGHTLATGNSDNTILWDLAGLNFLRHHATERACSITGRGLNREEWARFIPGLPYQQTCPS